MNRQEFFFYALRYMSFNFYVVEVVEREAFEKSLSSNDRPITTKRKHMDIDKRENLKESRRKKKKK